jgi:prefoldin subunit 5
LQKNKSQNLVLDERIKNLHQDLATQNHKLKILEEDNNDLRNFKGRYEHAQGEINGLYAEKAKNLAQIDVLNHKILAFEKQKELLAQNLGQLEKEKSEWQKSKETILLRSRRKR